MFKSSASYTINPITKLAKDSSLKLVLRRLSEIRTITARPRSAGDAGSRKSRHMREAGLIPGVIYGVDNDKNILKRMVTVDKKAMMKELSQRGKSFENTLYEVFLEGESEKLSYLVTPRQVQYCPRNKLRIPVDFVNAEQSQDIKRGSFVVPVKYFLDCICDGNEIPALLTLDLSSAQKGDVYRVSSLKLPPKVRPAKNVQADTVLAIIKSVRGAA